LNNNEEKQTPEQKENETVNETAEAAETTETVEAEVVSEAPAEDLEKKVASLEDQLLRKVAEFDNYRKRTIKEKEEIGLTAKIKCVGELLPILDTLERALQIGCSDEEFLRGVKLTYDNMTGAFTKMGLEEIKAEGEKFDPELHYAVARVENPDLGENIVASVMQKGYTMNGKVVRHAMVAVANA
jgi:molecular chaperone GrpE